MSTTLQREWTIADLSAMFGPMPARRIRQHPPAGTATVRDVRRMDRKGVLCELVDGVLVEKTVGFEESHLAARILVYLSVFVTPRKLGAVLGADGTIRLNADLVRIPDVAYYSTERMQQRRPRKSPIPFVVPNLAIEVISASNTDQEMTRKLHDYFTAGVELVWYFNPPSRTVDVWTDPEHKVTLSESQTLDGGAVLPGFELPLKELFALLDT